jgi:hypothetical protein
LLELERVDGFDEVAVEARLERAASILFQPVTRKRDEKRPRAVDRAARPAHAARLRVPSKTDTSQSSDSRWRSSTARKASGFTAAVST